MTLHSAKRFGLMPIPAKAKRWKLAGRALEQLEAAGAAVVMEPEAAATLGRHDLAVPADQWERLDAVVVVGGDGALLRASRVIAGLSDRCWPSTSGGSAF